MSSCVVCGKPGQHNYHFGARTCGACGAFFRRTIAEQRVYQCRKGKNCDIKKDSRSSCRACRLQKCVDVGMFKTQGSKSPAQESSNLVSYTNLLSTTSINEDSKSGLITPTIVDISINYPTLHQLLTGVRTFLSSQKSLVTLENKAVKFPDKEYVFVKKHEYDVMERHCIILIFSMLNDFFEPFKMYSQEDKIQIMKNYAVKFNTLMKSYLTSMYFPSMEDKKWMTHYGQVIDTEDSYHFICNHVKGEFARKTRSKTLGQSLLNHSKRLAYQFFLKNITEIDVAALAYIVFSLETEKLSLGNEHIEKMKNLVFEELSGYYISTMGNQQGILKYSNVLYLVDRIMASFVML
uniref:Nuclear receptor domain-containing protein n=1 Tax=Acrobeloides nanus TaxID=290746 RepID=A0A914EGH8_9BILA